MPSFILIRPTVWPQYTNVTDRQDRQTDSIGRTILQTVAQKRLALCYRTVVRLWHWCIVEKWLDGSRRHLVYGGRPRLRPHCVKWGPSSPRQKGAQQPSTFRPMSTVAKRSPTSATAELLYKRSPKNC